jgi:secondary thiamine-phosphate synthase enzyme
MVYQHILQLDTAGRGSHLITDAIQQQVRQSGITTGLCHVFLRHTSASLMLCENADPDVHSDLERFMRRLVPDGDAVFAHIAEGPDDMAAHVRTVLTHSDLTLPVSNGRCAIGTWQGVYLWEHRHASHRRQLAITVYGE